jgi:lipopolysaccharide export system protein LptA
MNCRIKGRGVLLMLVFSLQAVADVNHLPVQIQSDSAMANLVQGVAAYSGHVQVTQGTRKLEANHLTLLRASNGAIESIAATGSPAKTEDQPKPNVARAYGEAETIYYYPQDALIKYKKNAKFTQAGNIFEGDEITYNIATQVVSSPKTTAGQGNTTIILPAYSSPLRKETST